LTYSVRAANSFEKNLRKRLLQKTSGKLFVKRHGMEKFAKFMKLYEEYTNGKTPTFLIAKELEA